MAIARKGGWLPLVETWMLCWSYYVGPLLNLSSLIGAYYVLTYLKRWQVHFVLAKP